jgi:hypothetical protein
LAKPVALIDGQCRLTLLQGHNAHARSRFQDSAISLTAI